MFTTSRLTIFASFFLGALTVAMGALLLVRSGYDRVALLPTAAEPAAAPPSLAVGMSWYLGEGSPYSARPEPRFGAVFREGDLYLNKDNYELWEHNGGHWGSGPVAALSLQEGPMGLTGPAGPPGPAGSRGPQGPAGPVGPPGRDGVGSDGSGGGGFLTPTEVGSEGSGGDGADGPPGLLPPAAVQPEFEGSEPDPVPPAPQGVAAGPAGPAGPPGPPGAVGPSGPPGPEGPAGPRGRRGPAGQDGAGVDGEALRELVAEELAVAVDDAVSEALTAALADLPGELTDLIDERLQDKVGPAGPAGPPGERGPRGRRGYDGADGADGGPRVQVFYFTGALVENNQSGQNDGDILFVAKPATAQSPRLLCGVYVWRDGQWGSYDAHGTWHNGRAIGNANSC